MIQLDVTDEQNAVLRDVLETQKRELLLQDAKADTRDFKQVVLRKLDVVEQLLAKLPAHA